MDNTQTKLIDIAKEFIRVCNILNLRYFADSGTCLGAIRHKGFIPWDDDMDFSMPREDYEILRKKWNKIANKRFFLQIQETDHDYPLSFMKIRDSSTTAVEPTLVKYDINHGLWIDIFPLDGVPKNNTILSKIERKSNIFYRHRYFNKHYDWGTTKSKIWNICLMFVLPSKRLARYLDIKQYRRYNFDRCDEVFANFWGCQLIMKRKWFDDSIIVDFENIKMKVPKMYDEYLTCMFSNWKELPPEEERIPHHDCIIFDLDKPYTHYKEEIEKLKNEQ